MMTVKVFRISTVTMVLLDTLELIDHFFYIFWSMIFHCPIVAGGTFALYSLICRHAKVSLLPNQLPSDARISSFRLKVPSPELERSLKIKERLESSLTLKKVILILVLAGTSMVIADGVVTPAMSGILSFPLFFYLSSSLHFFHVQSKNWVLFLQNIGLPILQLC